MRILVIEDDEGIRAAYAEILKEENHQAIFSLDLEEIARTVPQIDLVLSDYEMGLDFGKISELAEENQKPLLLVTGHSEGLHRNQLKKPFRVDALLAAIEGAANERKPFPSHD